MTMPFPDSAALRPTWDAFAQDVRRFVTEALPHGNVYGVTASGHSVAACADEARGTVSVRVNDHEGRAVETTTGPDGPGLDLPSLWVHVTEAGIRPAPPEPAEPGPRPRRHVRPTASSVLEFAAAHLQHVGLHPGPWDWARDARTGPATITHAVTLAVRQLGYNHRSSAGAAALGRLADRVHGCPVVVPPWWNASTEDYYRATVWNWGSAPGRTAAGAAAFLRGAAALAAV
ncbi:DUF6197 family protein [Kitasatospora sp. NPDC002965]|uniref:DUF6197 family protein n=1 Tax=Kitasatospora sp. NPDC002965 TaxID=3154775 RepID=UPI0033A7E463